MKKLLLVATMLGALASPASADVLLQLNAVIGDSLGANSANNPCIISGQNCPQQPGTFGFNNYQQGGNISVFDTYSTTPTSQLANGAFGLPYTALQIALTTQSLGVTIAIDTNTAQNGERLLGFQILQAVGAVGPGGGADIVLAHYTGPGSIAVNQNGNGFADYTLTGFSFAGLGFNGSEQIYFHATWDTASDGAEQFFLVGAGPTINPQCPFGGCDVPVPGPIVGAGLPSLIVACGFLLAFARRRRQFTA